MARSALDRLTDDMLEQLTYSSKAVKRCKEIMADGLAPPSARSRSGEQDCPAQGNGNARHQNS